MLARRPRDPPAPTAAQGRSRVHVAFGWREPLHGYTRKPMTPVGLVAEFIARLPYPLDDFQLDAIRALANGHSVLVAAPTGTGKTVIADFGVFQARTSGLRAFYTTPIKALSNQKYRDYKSMYGADVGLLTGDISLNADAPIVIMTTESLRNMLVTAANIDDVGTIVFDHVHYMGDP